MSSAALRPRFGRAFDRASAAPRRAPKHRRAL